jgi:predicted thioesterase
MAGIRPFGGPLPATQYLVAAWQNATLAASTAYLGFHGDTLGGTATEADHQQPNPVARTLVGLTARVNAAVTAGRTLVVAFRATAADLGATLTITPADGTTPVRVAQNAAIPANALICARLTGDGVGSITAGSELTVTAEVQ